MTISPPLDPFYVSGIRDLLLTNIDPSTQGRNRIIDREVFIPGQGMSFDDHFQFTSAQILRVHRVDPFFVLQNSDQAPLIFSSL
jgi:hypothetical protein